MLNPGNWSKNWPFRVYYCVSKNVFWIAAMNPNARFLALVFTDKAETGSAICPEPGGSIQQATCRANTSAAHIMCRHWQLLLITSEHARDSWALAVTPMGLWDVSSQLHTGWATHLFSVPPSLNNHGRMGGAWWEWRWKRGVMSGSGDRWVGGRYSRSLIRCHGAL